jgi:hypothetical protein
MIESLSEFFNRILRLCAMGDLERKHSANVPVNVSARAREVAFRDIENATTVQSRWGPVGRNRVFHSLNLRTNRNLQRTLPPD